MSDSFPPQSPAPPAAAAAPPPPPPPAPAYPPVILEKKSPALAGFLSMFPGLGHLYLGLYQRAFAFAGAFIVCIGMASRRGGDSSGPLIAFVWFFAIIDAVRQAKAINRGYAMEAGFAGTPQLKRAAEGTGSLTWGIILFGIGGALAGRQVRGPRPVLGFRRGLGRSGCHHAARRRS